MHNGIRSSWLAAVLMGAALPALGEASSDENARRVVEATCNVCHQLAGHVAHGYDAQGWHTVVRMMLNQGAPLPQDQVAMVTDYLIKTYPEKDKPPAKVIPGPVKVSMQEWSAPTPGSRPHDPLVASDGSIWYSGQMANVLARVDPATLEIKEYKLPDPAARPRRITITSDDIIWYTDFARGFLGRLDPATGTVTEWPSPSGPKSAPYGISAIHDVIWYSESNAKPNTVVRFDPPTEKFQSWTIPGGGNIVRNTAVTKEGDFVLANSLVNGVTLVRIGH